MSVAFQALLLLLSRHRHRQLIAENQFLKVENEILRKKCGKIILDRADRARLRSSVDAPGTLSMPATLYIIDAYMEFALWVTSNCFSLTKIFIALNLSTLTTDGIFVIWATR